jgi:cell filamentation protein
VIGPRSAREHVEYARVVYPGTSAYVNKLDIRDQTSLEKIERYLSATRARQGFPSRASFRNYAGFKAIHRHLFQDLDSWAGRERLYTTGRGSTPFAVPEHINTWMVQQFDALRAERYLAQRSLDGFAKAAAVYVSEINAAHPFIDGNGRTLRFWLRMLADNAGFELRLKDTDRERWNDASGPGLRSLPSRPNGRAAEATIETVRQLTFLLLARRWFAP